VLAEGGRRAEPAPHVFCAALLASDSPPASHSRVLSPIFMPPALFLLAFYPAYLALVLSLLASLKTVLLATATTSPTAIVRGLVA